MAINRQEDELKDISSTGISKDYYNEYAILVMNITRGLYKRNFEDLLAELRRSSIKTYTKWCESREHPNLINNRNPEAVKKLDKIVGRIKQEPGEGNLTPEILAETLKEMHRLIYGEPFDYDLLPFLKE